MSECARAGSLRPGSEIDPSPALGPGPLFFPQSEWSTHAAKRCIDTAPPKGLRGAIPPNFPYFHVEFGLAAGFVHVIDDEAKWPRQFARDVLVRRTLSVPAFL